MSRVGIFLAFLFLLCCGCSQRPGERPARFTEMEAVADLRDVVAPGIGCEALDDGNVFVWEAPPREVNRYCSGGRWEQGTLACTTGTYNNGIFTPGMEINIGWDYGWRLHHNLVQHEAMHHLLGCLIGHNDRRHQDERWTDGTMQEAQQLFLRRHPVPVSELDDPYARLPRRPWDLTGTRYEGRDCEMQPQLWINEGSVPGCGPRAGFEMPSGDAGP